MLTRRRKAELVAIAALLVCLCLGFSSMVFSGAEPVAGDTISAKAHAVWLHERWGGDTRPQWYPDILLGMPSYASFIWTPGSPLAWLHNTFDLNRGTRYVIWLFAGGIGAFFLFRRWGGSVPAAFAAAGTYIFTPYVFGLVNAGHSSKLMALAFAPLVWLGVEWVMSRPGLLSTAFAAWAIAFQLWANHPQIVMYTWLLLGPYVLIQWWREGGDHRWTGPAALTAAFVLAALMVTLPYWPIYAYTAESTRGAASVLSDAAAASGTQSWEYATNWSFHPRELISLVFPSFFGLQSPTYWGWMPFTQSSHSTGTVPLVLAVLGVWVTAGWRRWFLLGAAVAVLFVGFGRHAPILFGPLYHLLPFFDKFRIPSMIYSMLPLIAAFALIPALDGAATHDDRLLRAKRVVLAMAALFGATALFGLAGTAGLGSGLAESGWFHRMFNASMERPSLDLISERRSMLFGDLVRASFLALGTLAAIWFGAKGRLRAPAVYGIVLALLAVDLITVDRPFYNPRPPAESLAASRVSGDVAAAIKSITPGGAPRVLPIELVAQRTADGQPSLVISGVLQSNDYGFSRIGSVGGYHPAGLRRMNDFIASGAWRNPGLWPGLGIDAVVFHARASGVPESFWQQLGSQYPGLSLVHHTSSPSGDVAVFSFSGSLGDAYVVPNMSVVPDAKNQLLRISSETFDPARTVVVDEPLETSGVGGRVTAVERADERLTIRVSGGGGVLVVPDAYAAGWRASVDGTDVAVVPANHVMRGISVPAGDHEVVFAFAPPGFAAASVAHTAGKSVALLALLMGIALEFRRSRKRAEA